MAFVHYEISAYYGFEAGIYEKYSHTANIA